MFLEKIKEKVTGKAAWLDVTCVAMFVAIAFFYFYPAVLDGRRLTGEDHSGADGLSVEIETYRQTHDGETPRWINSIFSGMPTYQIAPSYDSTDTIKAVEKAYHLWLPDYVWYVFASLLGFYILLRAFDFKQWMAALGAVVWAFSSYFFIIIAAGHIWKVITLAYIPPTIAGVVMCYRGKYLWGGIVTALFAALQVMGNHVQMTYYFLIPELLMIFGFLIEAVMKKKVSQWLKATGVVAAAAILAVALNISNLYHTYKYADETMRGKSELVKQGRESDQTDSGLERSYITMWSYGIDETMTLLIPNFRGGASVPLAYNEKAMSKASSDVNGQFYNYFTQYWGDQPSTSGPVYVGALVCLLFVLALIILPNRNVLKWTLLAATILSIMLAWGKNFMGLTDFFIDYVPLYSKFRTVASILVVAEFTIPLLALLGLREFVEQCADRERRRFAIRSLAVSGAIVGIVCFIFAVAPSMSGSGTSSEGDARSWSYLEPQLQQGYAGYILQQNPGMDETTAWNQATQIVGMEKTHLMASLPQMRYAMVSNDAKRSLIIVLLGCLILFGYYKYAEKRRYMLTVACVSLLVVSLYDMWEVNKRYLNDSMFIRHQTASAPALTDADRIIQQTSGTNRDYRVLNLAVNTFNDNTTSFYYNSIGGYHPAKLRRYQELVEEHLGGSKGMNMAVLNMLNTQWIITRGEQAGQVQPMHNPDAFGNAWLVDTLLFVDNANEELDALHNVNLRTTAVINKDFADVIGKETPAQLSAGDTIRLASLTSTSASYEVNSKRGAVAVFSEIYYPDWTVSIDGNEVQMARADYVLRTLRVPAGKHTIKMTFDPQSIHTTETIAYIALALLVLGAIIGIFFAVKKSRS